MGRSLRCWPSSDRWSVPSAGCIGQSTRAKPMERSQTPKVLRLVTDSMFVSLPPSIFLYMLSVFSFFLSSLFLHGLKRLKYVLTTQSWHARRAHYTWGLLIQKLNITMFRALCPRTCVIFQMYLFFAIICIDMTYVLTKLGCLALVFMPYIPVNSARA